MEGQRGGGVKSLIKAEKELHPQRTWKGHFLQMEEIREGFLEGLNPELSLEELGVNWGRVLQGMARKPQAKAERY